MTVPKIAVAIVLFFVVLAGLVICFGSWGTVTAGHRGVVLRMGAVKGEIKGEGFYTKTPWMEHVVEMDVRQQKEQIATECASKDLQVVHATVALNLSLLPEKCTFVYQTIGEDYLPKVVAPAMQESIKAIIAQYTVEELVSKRELVRVAISELIGTKLTTLGIKTEALNIVNMDFSKSYNEAIENKMVMEQHALAAKNTLSQKEFEAQQLVATAKGKAESMQIESAALAKNPQVLVLRALEKWNGELPKVIGGATPLLDMASMGMK